MMQTEHEELHTTTEQTLPSNFAAIPRFQYAAHIGSYLKSLVENSRLSADERATADGLTTSKRGLQTLKWHEAEYLDLRRPIPKPWFEVVGGNYDVLMKAVEADQAAYDAVKDQAIASRTVPEPLWDDMMHSIELPDDLVEEADIVKFLAVRAFETKQGSCLQVGEVRTYKFGAYGYEMFINRPTINFRKRWIIIERERIFVATAGGNDATAF
ncbi:MAG: hypothetical protein P4L33_07475 [Capsulimonadaceae bacterium]|nr:hypothetical protein [Capsulimonadaceae bacterium]